MKLTEINIYPIKSMGSLSLKEANVLKAGLEHDRRWLLLDENQKFMTQRTVPEMALVKFQLNENGFKAFYKNDSNNPVFIPFEIPTNAKQMTAQVWDDQVQAHKMSAPINEWFSHIFNKECLSLIHI